MNNARLLLLNLLVLLLPGLTMAASPAQRIQQLVDYVGVDYQGAVSAGRVANATEYAEMVDFTTTLAALADELASSPEKEAIRDGIDKLRNLVRKKAEASRVSARAGELRRLLIDSFGMAVVPRKAPDLQRGKQLYARACASCHGAAGRGDGPLAPTLKPAPTDFTDMERYNARTLHGLYATITHGVEGTAMQSHAALPEMDRWSLAFYVGMLAPRAAGESDTSPLPGEIPQRVAKKDLTTLTPAELAARLGDGGERWVALLRARPQLLYANDESTLTFARHKLEQALAAYRNGNADKAHELAVTAYLEGFELVEGNLDAVDSKLRHEIEGAMTTLRGQIKRGVPAARLEASIERIDVLLQSAKDRLDNTRLSPATAFTSALLILLREGLEAILVIAALAAFLIKTGRRDGLRYLYRGVVGAMLLGVLTWYLSAYVVRIGGAGRELTEGFAALFAAIMLFYVGFWLHSKTGAAQWKHFIQGSVQKALGKGSLWGLSALAFIAVYREIFETVLFYQALWIQTSETGRGMLFTGLLTAAGLLVLLAWLLLRYSTRLPLRQFFSVTSIFMFVLAVVFAGKGIAALQEAGKLPVNLIDFPSIELLGIYPNLEGLSVQFALIAIAGALLWKSHRSATG